MKLNDIEDIFTKVVLDELLPPNLSDDFFEALYGDASEGAYNISLSFNSYDAEQKHPLINMQGIVENIVKLLDADVKLIDWKLGHTETPAAQTHVIPLKIQLDLQ
jgi:hypothetical protein